MGPAWVVVAVVAAGVVVVVVVGVGVGVGVGGVCRRRPDLGADCGPRHGLPPGRRGQYIYIYIYIYIHSVTSS